MNVFFPSEAAREAFLARKAQQRRRRAHYPRPHVRALATFARAVQRMTPAEQRAAIEWLMRRFLGLTLEDRCR